MTSSLVQLFDYGAFIAAVTNAALLFVIIIGLISFRSKDRAWFWAIVITALGLISVLLNFAATGRFDFDVKQSLLYGGIVWSALVIVFCAFSNISAQESSGKRILTYIAGILAASVFMIDLYLLLGFVPIPPRI
jgi:hypothetical protein